jgi:hypothetical protein
VLAISHGFGKIVCGVGGLYPSDYVAVSCCNAHANAQLTPALHAAYRIIHPVSDLDFSELTSSVQQMITQASKMSSIETDHEIGAQQCVDVKDICDGVTITSGAQTFDVKVMDWKVKGKNWIVMQRAKGPVFNELPATTPQETAL